MGNVQGRVVVLAATNRLADVDPALRRPSRFDREIPLPAPTPALRRDILRNKLAYVAHSINTEDVYEVADVCHGFVHADVAALVAEATLACLRRVVGGGEVGGGVVSVEDLRSSVPLITPTALRDVHVTTPTTTFSDIGGQDEAKQKLTEAILWPRQLASTLASMSLPAIPQGVLLYGPPGGGKTLLLSAVAHLAGMGLLVVQGGELYSAYVGETEQAIVNMFNIARECQPCLIVFDEIDGLVGTRQDEGGSQMSTRVISTLLQQMDGLKQRGDVAVCAATNRPQDLDPALLRPGRFDQLVHVPAPKQQDIKHIINIHLQGVTLDQDVDLEGVAVQCVGMSGADVAAMCTEAKLAALDDDVDTDTVNGRHFTQALEITRSSISQYVDDWGGKKLF